MERRIVDYVIDCFFIVDCLLNFRTTYHVEETNELVASTRTIARRYVRGTSAGIGVGWFWPDAIGALPWDLTGARGLKLLKLLRVFQLRKPIARETGKSVNVRRVLNILMNFMIGSHWVGCVWWAIGTRVQCRPLSPSSTFHALQPSPTSPTLTGALETDYAIQVLGVHPHAYRKSWLQRIPDMKWNSKFAFALSAGGKPQVSSTHTAFTPSLHPLTLSPSSFPLPQGTFAMQYFSSLYWSFTALVKVPWIAPNTELEKLYAAAIVMIGAIFFASLLGSIVAAIAAIERTNSQRRDKMTLMHNFSASRRLPPSVKSQMTRYVDAMFSFNNDVSCPDRSARARRATPRLFSPFRKLTHAFHPC